VLGIGTFQQQEGGDAACCSTSTASAARTGSTKAKAFPTTRLDSCAKTQNVEIRRA